ncbi:MAG: DUF1385 domain-containing protein [Clostridiales bacterium]|nr:DUF1385 domain-containing protein [Clostridiales bacterium]
MDLNKIFIKNASPTKVGGQAVLEGIMMRGEDRTSVVVRFPDDSMHIKTEKLPEKKAWAKYPIIRGVFVFAGSLVQGTKTLMYSAEVMESYEGEGAIEYEDDKLSLWLEAKFGKKGAWNAMLYFSVVLAILFTVGIFIIGPTWVVNFCGKFISNEVALNLIEGVLRIVLFVLYVVLISKMSDIRKVFQYHGAEHLCIHCYENAEELTPENCLNYYTLHPRCGTSFLMFVMVISLIMFSLLGWPNLFWRITSRLLLIPVIAGLSYELLKWAGRSDNWFVKVLSLPGLYLQKLTTRQPDTKQLEVAIAAMKAVLVDESEPCIEGSCDKDGRLVAMASEEAPVEVPLEAEQPTVTAEPEGQEQAPEEPEGQEQAPEEPLVQ